MSRRLIELCRLGKIDPQKIADHIHAITAGADQPVREAAAEALAWRFLAAEREDLRVLSGPHGTALGEYRTGSRSALGYRTWILSLSPLATSCSCEDFVRNGLGLCKHGLVVLEAIRDRLATEPIRADFCWQPIPPLRGSADRLARLRFQDRGPDAKFLENPKERLKLIVRALDTIAGGARAEPAVSTVLCEELERVKRELANRAAAGNCIETLSSLRRRLYPYQEEGVRRFFEAGRLLLADDMGLGKTVQAIAACHGLFVSGRVERGLLIMPAALKPQWLREWEATTDTPLTLVDGDPKQRARAYQRAQSGFLAIGYEQLLRDLAEVQRFSAQMVVLDEGQRIKNAHTKSARYVKLLEPEFRLVLTGTPMENRFEELASIMDFVDDVALQPKWRLAPWHTIERQDGHGGAGARNLDTLRERLAPTMLRRVRSEVLRQLPPRTDTRVPIEMTHEQREAHARLVPPIAKLLQESERKNLTQTDFMRLMQLLNTQRIICNGLAQHRFEEDWLSYSASPPTDDLLAGLCAPKLETFRDLIREIVVGQKRKAVVFSQWRNMLQLSEWCVRDLLATQGMRALFFTGGQSQKVREEAIRDFHDDPTAALMFLSDAGGVGLNLQRAASCCINLELPWNPAVLEQRIGRIYRLGQSQPIDVYHLVCEAGIEERIAVLIAQKQAVFTSLFDGAHDEVRFESQRSFLENLRRVLTPGAPVQQPSVPIIQQPSLSIRQPTAPPALPELSMTRMPDGSLRVDAPPELAATLTALLETWQQRFAKSVGKT